MSTVPDAAPTGRADVPTLSTAPPSRLFRATLLASASLTIMAAAVIAPSLPEMSRMFAGLPGADVLVRLSLTVTSLAIGLTAPLAGALTDRVGRKPVLITSLLLYTVAGVGGYLTPDLTTLLGSRALLGLAVGGLMSSIGAMITDLFDGPRRARFMGLQSAAASAGGVVFLPLAGVLAGVSWRAPFWIYGAALLVVPLAVAAARETHRRTGVQRPDPVPVAGGRLSPVLTLAVIGTLVFFMAPTQLPFLLHGFGSSPTTVGVVVAGSTASSAVAALGYARLRRWLGHGPITVASLGALGAGWVVVGTSAAPVPVLLGVLIGGIGVGLIVPDLTLRISESVPVRRRGRALGGLVSAIFLGQFLSPLVLAPVVSTVGVGAAFLVTGVALAGGAAVLGWTHHRRGAARR